MNNNEMLRKINKHENKDIPELREQLEHNTSKDKFKWKNFDKGYISIIVDDYQDDLVDVWNLFKAKNVLISCAIPTIKIEQDISKVNLLKEIISHNGEIFSHGYKSHPITSLTSIDDVTIEFEKSKKILERNGIMVNGYVKAGGDGAIEFTEQILNVFYKNYLYGFGWGEDSKLLSRVNIPSDVNIFKSMVDDAIANKTWLKLYFHGLNEINSSVLSQMLDYIVTSGITPTTYNIMYYKFGVGNNSTEQNVNKKDSLNSFEYTKEIDDRTLFHESCNLIKNSSFTNFNSDIKWLKDTFEIGNSMWWTTYDRGFYTAVRYNIPKELTGRFKLSQEIGKSRSNIGDIFKFGIIMQQQLDNNSVTLRMYKQYDNESSLILVAEKTFEGRLSNEFISIEWLATNSLDITNIKIEIEFNRPDTTSTNIGYFYLPKLTILTKEKWYQGITY